MTQQTSKLLTISIAAYNAEASLARTLDSLAIRKDLMELLDIIVVDDGSEDRTAEIAAGYASRYPGIIRVISKSNGGYGSTVNAAAEAAEGKYFKLLDGDDTFDTEGLCGLVRFLGGTDAELVISPFVYEHRTVSGDVRSEPADRHAALECVPVRLEDAKISDGLMMFEMCVKTEVLRRSGLRLTEKCFYTDNEYVMAAELFSSDVVRYPVPVYRYSLGVEGQSMSIEGRRAHLSDKIRAASGVFDIYEGYAAGGPAISGTRRLITDKLISTMVREIFVTHMLMEDLSFYRSRLRESDEELRLTRPEIYRISGQSRLVASVRRAGPVMYRLIAHKILAGEQKRTGRFASPVFRTCGYIAAACMIVQCRTIYMHLEDIGRYVNRGTWAVMMAALLVCILFRRDGRFAPYDGLRKRPLMICAALAVYALIFILVNPVNYLRVIRCASAVIMMILLAGASDGRERTRDILTCFSDLMVLIAGISLFCWIFGSTLHILPGTGFVDIDWSATGQYVSRPTFIHIYYETQWTGWEIVPARNSGIFVEAPMAGFCCSMAVLADYALGKSAKSLWKSGRTILLAVTIFTTFSVTNYIFLFLLAVFSMSGNISSLHSLSRRTKIIVYAAASAVTVFAGWVVYHKLSGASGSVRLNDFEVGLNAWLAHPFFGGGFESLEYLQQFMEPWRLIFDKGFSNSPTEILGQGGLYIGALYIYAFAAGVVKAASSGDRRAAAVIILFAYLFTLTVVPYQYITFFMLVMMACGHLNQLKNEPHE